MIIFPHGWKLTKLTKGRSRLDQPPFIPRTSIRIVWTCQIKFRLTCTLAEPKLDRNGKQVCTTYCKCYSHKRTTTPPFDIFPFFFFSSPSFSPSVSIGYNSLLPLPSFSPSVSIGYNSLLPLPSFFFFFIFSSFVPTNYSNSLPLPLFFFLLFFLLPTCKHTRIQAQA
jgi:hypothetical protein